MEALGFDLSIIVTRWFIPLFSLNMPFSLVFRIWDYLFIVGISGLFRVTMALLLQYKKIILQSDLVQLSSFIHDVGLSHLHKEKEVQAFFKTMISLRDVGLQGRDEVKIDRSSYVQLYNEFSDRCRVTFDLQSGLNCRMSEECKLKHQQLSSDISVLLERIKNIHDEEVLLRNDLRNNLLDETRFTDELSDLNEKKAKAERSYVKLLKLGQRANLQEYASQISVLEECIQQVETDLDSLKKRITERIESENGETK